MSQAGHRKKAAKRADVREHDEQLDQILSKVVDGGLAGCIFLVPLLLGGRQALGQLVLVSLAVIVAVAWTLRQCLRREFAWRYSSVELLLVLGVGLLVLQLTPLSASMMARVAPQSVELLPMWTAQADPTATLGIWRYASLTPAATRTALSLLLAYGLLFLVTVQRIRVIEDAERLLRWMALSALIMASFALLQLLISNGKFFWFYEHPFTDTHDVAKGSFTNRNHFAHFLALGMGPLIWWLQHNPGESRRHRQKSTLRRLSGDFRTTWQVSGFRMLGLGIVLFAGLLSFSRAGVVVMFLAAAICVAVCYRAKTLGIRFVLSLTGVALLIGVLLTIHGYDRLSDRMNTLTAGSIDELDGGSARRTIWATVIKAIPDYALLGSGVGSHREVYPMYLEKPSVTEHTHAENGPLQVLLETGVVGLTMVIAGIAFCAYWCIAGLRNAKNRRLCVCAGAISAGLAVSVVHSLTDFVWYVPACMAIVALLAACACRVWQLAREETQGKSSKIVLPRYIGAAMAVLLLVVGAWMIAGRIGPALAGPHWNRYQIMRLAAGAPHPSHEAAGLSLETLNKLVAELEKVVQYHPDNARAHLRLGEAYLQRFDMVQEMGAAEIGMPLAQIRDATLRARAAAKGERAERAAEEWLSRTIADQGDCLKLALQHTQNGLTLCPLQGEGYLQLAKLHFLQGPSFGAAKSVYVDQALRVRPLHGAVLLEAGCEAVLGGDLPRGMHYWQRSFHAGRKYQRQLIALLAGRVPVDGLLANFQPDLYAMRLLHARYRALGQPEHQTELYQAYAQLAQVRRGTVGGMDAATAWLEDQLTRLRSHHVQVAVAEAQTREGKEAAAMWLEATWLCGLLDDSERSLQYARNALQADPNDYQVRYALGVRLAKESHFAEAEEQFNWCLQRRPNDQRLQRIQHEVVKRRIDNEDQIVRRDQAIDPLH